MNRNRLLFPRIQTLPPSIHHHHKWKEVTDFVCKTNQWEILGDELPTKSPVELKDKSYITSDYFFCFCFFKEERQTFGCAVLLFFPFFLKKKSFDFYKVQQNDINWISWLSPDPVGETSCGPMCNVVDNHPWQFPCP